MVPGERPLAVDESTSHDAAAAPAAGPQAQSGLRRTWQQELQPGQRSALLAWLSFTVTFGAVRALTHWIKAGHGPSSGGMSAGGKHFHHYNLGITLLTAVGAVGIRGHDKHRHHAATAVAYGAATAMIVDEAALLLDLQDVYWSQQGRTSVDLGVGVIGCGGLALAGRPLLHALRRRHH
jgi:hypothetical protein